MTGPVHNAFNSEFPARTPSFGPGRAAVPFTRPMRSLQAQLTPGDDTTTLELTPMRPADVARALHAADAAPDAVTLVLPTPIDGSLPADVLPMDAVLSRVRIPVVERFGPSCVALDDAALADLLRLFPMDDVVVVRVHGPVEARDARAIAHAIAIGHDPLAIEMRAVLLARIAGGSDLTLTVRDRNAALAVVAENFRHYLAALLGRPAGTIAMLEAWQIDRLMSVTGRITVRPIETQVYSTFIDVGVNTSETGEQRPADRTLIYDLPSNSWHDEP